MISTTTTKADETKVNLPENSAEYSSDGEKIYCGLEFTPQGDKTVEELAMIVESAKAKDFEDSLKNVVVIKIDE